MDSVLAFVLGVLAIVLGVAVSVGAHELGHLVTAKAFGIKVTKYFIGFGPTIWSRTWGETEYGLKWIPLGGFCSIAGMYPEKDDKRDAGAQDAGAPASGELRPGEEHRAFYLASVWKRLVVMLGGIAANLVLAVVFFGIALSGFGTAQLTTTLSSVSQCVLPATSDRQSCEASDPVAPGYAAGLQPGDTILSIDGTQVSRWDQISALIQPSAGESMSFVVRRGAEDLALSVTPVASLRYVTDSSGQIVTDASGTKQTTTVGFVGIGPTTALVAQPLGTAITTTWNYAGQVGTAIVTLPQKLVGVVQTLFSSEQRAADSPVSVVGVGRAAGEIAASSALPAGAKWASLFSLIGALNVSLALFNLIPLLPLDGGHAAGALWEGARRGLARLRGRPDPGPFDASVLLPVTSVVTVLLIVIGGLLIAADIFDPISLFG